MSRRFGFVIVAHREKGWTRSVTLAGGWGQFYRSRKSADNALARLGADAGMQGVVRLEVCEVRTSS